METTSNSVDANQWVCLKCQTVVSATAPPTRRRNSVWWSKRGGIGVGAAGYATPGKKVCGYCGGGGLVPAGTPRGQKLLAAQGVQVTGNLGGSSSRTRPVIWVVLGLLGLPILFSILKSPSKPDILPGQNLSIPSPVLVPKTPSPARDDMVINVPDLKLSKNQAAQAAALKMNQAAAERGDELGLLRMGERYRDGEGVARDLAKAKEYLTRAAKIGNSDAKLALAKLPVQ